MRSVELKRIMLVDDDYAAHTFHKIMMEEAGLYENDIQVEECYSVEEALTKLLERTPVEMNIPEIILVDLNMPRKTGWDFLEEFQKIEFRGVKPFIYMVTNSENPYDIKRVQGYKDVVAFKTKFLDQAFFKKLLDGFLPN